jgi:hypothetical protein
MAGMDVELEREDPRLAISPSLMQGTSCGWISAHPWGMNKLLVDRRSSFHLAHTTRSLWYPRLPHLPQPCTVAIQD